MPNFFYLDQNNQKRGPVTDQQLKALAAQGVINPNTPLATDGGHKGTAGQIPGLFAAPPASPVTAAAPNFYYFDRNNQKRGPVLRIRLILRLQFR